MFPKNERQENGTYPSYARTFVRFAVFEVTCYVMLCYVMLCYVVLCCGMLNMLCYVIHQNKNKSQLNSFKINTTKL